MAALGNAAPIIIKRKKVISGGHHGGAWKVAYADFVTAMMAFFLLMWLISATTEEQRHGIADFFNPSIPLSRTSGGGDGVMGGDDARSERTMANAGRGATSLSPARDRQAVGQTGTDETATEELTQEQLESLEDALLAKSGESMMAEQLLRHVVTRISDEGLIIELFDLDNAPLFQGESAEPTAVTEALSAMLVEVFALVRNRVAVTGHTRSYPIVMRSNPAWDLSTERAQAMRRLLAGAGLDEARMQRVTGAADRHPVLRNTMASRNNRLEVVLLRR
ncbi:flagellar motor protein MotB [Plastorhodobacter daqingensis]|uniref:Flagellar motor protein MotB n=1 Tax=Plastorhodobacter daqingensis TaxID=1387281 RepID=A0ABW2UD50_9RHOB